MATYSNNYTFNRSTQAGTSPGYHTRTLFTFSRPVYPILTGSWADTLNYDGTSTLTSSYSTYCYGDPTFPGSYWRAGKSVRVRGTIFVASGGTDKFNLRFGINTPATSSIQWLAIQNHNSASHTAGTTATTAVDFQCTVTCLDLSGSGHSLSFNANGYYEYCLLDNSADSANDNKITTYVPLGFLNGGITAVSTSFYDNDSYVTFNLTGSTVTDCSLAFLTIEELA